MKIELFTYIGNDSVIESKQIIFILDYQLLQSSLHFKNCIQKHEKAQTIFGSQEDAKSVIMTDDGIYYSPFATSTLKNRGAFLINH